MFRSSQTLYVSVPAAATTGAHEAPSVAAPVRDGSPRRDWLGPRSADLAVVLAACCIAGFVVWILARGGSDLEASNAATGAAPAVCYASDCVGSVTPASRPLPREWRRGMRKIEFEHMYRE